MSLETLETMIEDLRRHGVRVEDPLDVPTTTGDPSDDYLPALAMAASAEALVSGDAHLISEKTLERPVMTPREFLETIA